MSSIVYTAGYSGASLAGPAQVAVDLNAVVFDIRLNPQSRISDWCKPEVFTAAASALAEVEYSQWSELAAGCIVAVAWLVDEISTEYRAFVEEQSDQERAFGDFSCGRYTWKLEDARQLPEAMAVGGKQGLWAWEAPAGVRGLLGI